MTREEAIQEFQNVKDLIRQDGKDWFDERDIELIDMAIEALTNEWTPITVSEPNTSDHVLVTYKWDEDDYETSEIDYWVTKYESEKGNEKCKWLIDHVIAWQSLPTPYKGGDAE